MKGTEIKANISFKHFTLLKLHTRVQLIFKIQRYCNLPFSCQFSYVKFGYLCPRNHWLSKKGQIHKCSYLSYLVKLIIFVYNGN